MKDVPLQWPEAEPSHRREWRVKRQALESGRMASTPDGLRRALTNRALSRALKLANLALRATAVDSLFSASTLRIQLREIDLAFASLPKAFDGFRILHLSDLHFDGVAGLGQALADRLEGLRVDICALTGDFRFADRGSLLADSVLQDIGLLQDAVVAQHPFLATLGNHDSHAMAEQLEERGLRVLTNERVVIHRRDETLQVTGIDDVHRFYTAAALTALSLSPAAPSTFRVALVHSPEFATEAATAGHDLYLCGHTHAGQICLPSRRPLIVQLQRNKALSRGIWREKGMIGHTSAGVGTSGIPLRMFCPGEATLLTLRWTPHRHRTGRGSGSSEVLQPETMSPIAMNMATYRRASLSPKTAIPQIALPMSRVHRT